MARIRETAATEEDSQPAAQSATCNRTVQQRVGPQHGSADLQAAQQVQARDQGGEEGTLVKGGDGRGGGQKEGGGQQEAVRGQVRPQPRSGVD